MVLDALQVPLVNEDDDLLALRLVDLLKDVFVSPVNEDLLDLREENLSASDVPVNEVLIKALLCECLGSSLSDLLSI